ncbi:tRNA pseudouridine(55) synthase TruB [Hydromonas duriensis]|uniref:tRNA pseudouridine synthase B n=1 Tax=Hydromonas duriensis TaxID=1527608 RepID=A0A4R6Y4Z8_9BURK|nr:tRNA pseudouridine(55) synthase TruB [Hydromonas duriensis]TDR29054.1 tRNA pseudouridine synthase B [Hydromonas duriensis]
MTEKIKKVRTAIDGVLLLYKPLGISSTQALGRAKWLLGALKAGHTGTLDPLADGLLPLCFGHATKLAHDLLDADKTYEARVVLGQSTTTGDAEGEVVFSSDTVVTRAQWDATVMQFVGDILQIPPMYSALKKDGKPLYEYARAGVELEREARAVRILKLETISFDYPNVVMSVTCSKGTYIRTLAQDMGEALGVGAHLSGLRRTAVGDLQLADALTLEQLETMTEAGRITSLLPLDALLQSLPEVRLDDVQAARFVQGQRLKISLVDTDSIRVYRRDQLIGVASISGHTLSPTKVLMTALPS